MATHRARKRLSIEGERLRSPKQYGVSPRRVLSAGAIYLDFCAKNRGEIEKILRSNLDNR